MRVRASPSGLVVDTAAAGVRFALEFRTATVKVSSAGDVKVVALDKKAFDHLVGESRLLREELSRITAERAIPLRDHTTMRIKRPTLQGQQ